MLEPMAEDDLEFQAPVEGLSAEAGSRVRRIRPTKALPTERIAFQKQLDILRAYVVAHEASGRAVTNAQVADMVKMALSTVPHANGFFVDVGLLQRGEGGYVPSADAISYNRAYHWDPETAGHKLAPTLRGAWFSTVLLPKLMFRGAIEDREAISLLADASGASPEFKASLDVLLDYLAVAGIVERDGGVVKKTATTLANDGSPRVDTSAPPPARPAPLEPPPIAPQAPASTSIEQHLLAILDPEGMSEDEQSAVWTLLKYLKKKGRRSLDPGGR